MCEQDVSEIMDRVEQLIAGLVTSVRCQKYVDREKVSLLIAAIDELALILQSRDLVSKKMVGTLWYAFTALLAEADHASQPEPILDAAWEIKEHLRRIFGPLPHPV